MVALWTEAVLLGALLSSGGSALAAQADVVNVPGPNSTARRVPVGQHSYTGCGSGLNGFVNILVSSNGQSVLLDPRVADWAGGTPSPSPSATAPTCCWMR